uniref:Reverse transcriptase domain-containing protein n=1 Tax=Oryzias melastigma TaxID=30732 RepID=A0A3B3BF62_ORYME
MHTSHSYISGQQLAALPTVSSCLEGDMGSRCDSILPDTSAWRKQEPTDSRGVLFNGSYSETQKLCCGVPQSSCLGPLLFSIFTNRLSFVLKHATIALYVDDSTIYMAGTNTGHLRQDLNDELRAVENWFYKDKLVINAEKTKCMMLGSNYLLKDSPAKPLGVIVDSIAGWVFF